MMPSIAICRSFALPRGVHNSLLATVDRIAFASAYAVFAGRSVGSINTTMVIVVECAQYALTPLIPLSNWVGRRSNHMRFSSAGKPCATYFISMKIWTDRLVASAGPSPFPCWSSIEGRPKCLVKRRHCNNAPVVELNATKPFIISQYTNERNRTWTNGMIMI